MLHNRRMNDPSNNHRIGGDYGEDDGMGMEFHDRPLDDSSSKVESAEKRDSVASLHYGEPHYPKKGIKVYHNQESKKKSKSAIIGGLRVRSNSTSGLNNSRYWPNPRGSVESNAIDDPTESFDYFYKIIIIGDELVGKTNFLLRCAKGFYDPKPKTTFGVEYLFKNVPLPGTNQRVKA